MKITLNNRKVQYGIVFSLTLFLCFCILFVKSYKNNKKGRYNFARTPYPNEFIAQINSQFDALDVENRSINSFEDYVLLKDYTLSRYDLYTVINHNGEKLKEIVLHDKGAELVAYSDSCMYLLSDYKLNFFKNNEEVYKTIFYQNKIVNAINVGKDKFLFLDVDTIYNNVSFSVCNVSMDILKCIKTITVSLTDKYKVFPEKVLAYSGSFSKAFGYITYTFHHIPYVYVFDNNGEFIATIKTKDNVPFPSIIRYKDYFVFERGNSFNSNISSFILDDIVCIFSYHSPANGALTIDCYNLSDGGYKGSIFLKDNGGKIRNNAQIDEVTSISDNILVRVEGKITTLKCAPNR